MVLHKKRRKRVSFSGVHSLLLFTAPANFRLKQPSPSFPTCSNVLEYRKGIDLGRLVACSNAPAKIGAVSADPVQITLETGPIFPVLWTHQSTVTKLIKQLLLALLLGKPDLAWLLSSCTVPYYLVTI